MVAAEVFADGNEANRGGREGLLDIRYGVVPIPTASEGPTGVILGGIWYGRESPYDGDLGSDGVLDEPTPTPTPQATAMPEGTTVHGPRGVVGLPSMYEDSDRDLEGRQASEQSYLLPNLEAIVCSYPWPQGCTYWLGVAWCESGWNPSAVSYTGAYIGLFQIWTAHGYTNLTDPVANTRAAWELSNGGTNTAPWPWCQYQ